MLVQKIGNVLGRISGFDAFTLNSAAQTLSRSARLILRQKPLNPLQRLNVLTMFLAHVAFNFRELLSTKHFAILPAEQADHQKC